MDQSVKKYVKGDITVLWQPGKCQHAKLCWTGLREVFDPRARPWINVDGAEQQRIIEQIEKCPSGALSYMRSADTE